MRGSSRTWGSSPRMRGTQGLRLPAGTCTGLIPTYAGNTAPAVGLYPRRWAHPHVCGEHLKVLKDIIMLAGSSPRMRGTRRWATPPYEPNGLIPTYAGNTCWPAFVTPVCGAHPHVCGEHPPAGDRVVTVEGSSPRMRGTRLGLGVERHQPGLIPTYAGNTLADMGFYPHTPSFRISLEPKASINPTRFLGLSPSGSTPIPASFAPPFPWP